MIIYNDLMPRKLAGDKKIFRYFECTKDSEGTSRHLS